VNSEIGDVTTTSSAHSIGSRRIRVAVGALCTAAVGALLVVPAVTSSATAASAVCAQPVTLQRDVVRGINDGGDLTDAQAAAQQADLQTRLTVKAVTGRGLVRMSGQVAPTLLSNGSVRIPVYFHVIRSGSASSQGSLTSTQVTEQINTLNEVHTYARTPFRFYLAALDYSTNSSWFNAAQGSSAESAMKRSLRRGGLNALNLYSISVPGGSLGYSTMPASARSNTTLDGVVVDFATMPNGSLSGYNQGDTAVHEAGHWLGLYHVFQGGCGGFGDYVSDTSAQAFAQYSCVTKDSCSAPGTDPVNNLMGYTPDSCMYQFTAGQSARMSDAWQAYRA